MGFLLLTYLSVSVLLPIWIISCRQKKNIATTLTTNGVCLYILGWIIAAVVFTYNLV